MLRRSRSSHLVVFLLFFVLLWSTTTTFTGFQANASPTGAIVRQLSSMIKWTRASPKGSQTDGNVLQFENGYLVETVVEGNKLGMNPYTIRVSPEGELFAVDSVNNNIVRITPPLSQYSRARLVAGSFQGYSGHVDGKPSDSRFNRPSGVTMDEKGNVYVADTSNLAIRKIGEAGVTTIAGGKSNVAGYRDGPSEDAKFSNDFDVVYVGSTCSLLVIDRGNAAIRQISFQQEDCHYQYSSVSVSDIVMVVGAVLLGYTSCLLQHGFGSFFFPKPSPLQKEVSGSECQDINSSIEKRAFQVEAFVEDPDAGWPSTSRLLSDLSKLAFEVVGATLLYLMPHNLFSWRSKKGLTPLKDHLVMPEDMSESSLVQKQKCQPPLPETLHTPDTSSSKFTPLKAQKISKQTIYKDPSLSATRRVSKRQEFAEFYGSSETPPSIGSKGLKERVRHRVRDKSGELPFGSGGGEPKSAEVKSVNYSAPKFDHFNIRSKFGTDDKMRF